MQIGVHLGLTTNWTSMLAAAQKADEYGFESLGFSDHYHSPQPVGYLCGWSLYGALALATSRIRLVPLVICPLNYLPGVLAKETTMLSLVSLGRFDLGIGAGDLFEEMVAWGVTVPKAGERVERLKELVTVLRHTWEGDPVTFEGSHFQVHGGLCLPAPQTAPRVVVGVGSSRRLLHSAVEYADEVNVSADDEMIREAREAIEAAGRPVRLSSFVWDWQEDIEDKLKQWEQLGVQKAFVTFWEPFEQLDRAAKWLGL